MGAAANTAHYLARNWRLLVLLLQPIALLPVLLAWRTEPAAIGRCAYIVLLMGTFWITEALPINVTAMMPLFLFPAAGLLSAHDAAACYSKDVIWLLIGSVIFSIAIEETGLHKRLALKVLLGLGTQIPCILLGIMLCTAFLSMWMSNTAATSAMIPVILAIAEEVRQAEKNSKQQLLQEDNKLLINATEFDDAAPFHSNNGDILMRLQQKSSIGGRNQEKQLAANGHKRSVAGDANAATSPLHRTAPLQPADTRLVKCLLLGTCYAASIGGTATLTGSPPNMILYGLLQEHYIAHGQRLPLTYASWIGYALPITAILLIFAWLWLQLLFLGVRQLLGSCKFCRCRPQQKKDNVLRQILQRNLQQLGQMNFGESVVLFAFLCLILLWLLRDPVWGHHFARDSSGKSYVTDASSVMAIVFLLFIAPAEAPVFLRPRRLHYRTTPTPYKAILNWQSVQEKVPWGIVFLIGAGFAISLAAQSSGLSGMLAKQLAQLEIPDLALVLLATAMSGLLTEFMMNTTTANILLPILINLASARSLNPMVLSLPATIAASFAFMLPVATAPNAIVFGTGYLRVLDMVQAGALLNLFGFLLVLLSISSWGWRMFDLGQLLALSAGNSTVA